ncbi:MAG: hypothetical protein AB2806_18235 [Candidatus Thiodiazotropha sp.]
MEGIHKKKFLLYIDILGFQELVNNHPEKVKMIYKIIDSLNVHQHHAFKTIVFSDTILVYNKNDPISKEDRRYLVMYACEFAQDLQHRLVGQGIYFRAHLVLGDFNHYNLENTECFYGNALIKAYLKEKNIQAFGLFIDNACNADNRIFPTSKYDKDVSFVYINQSLERLQRNTDGILPTDPYHFYATEEYWELIWDINQLKSIYRNMHTQKNPKVRVKYIATWQLFFNRYPKILSSLQASGFSLRAICDKHDWSSDLEKYTSEVSYFRGMSNA